MTKVYSFTVDIADASGQVWETHGSTKCELNDAFNVAMKEAFFQMTSGRVTYGPYDVRRIVIQQERVQ
jgi:hypothetical protein